MVTGIFYSNPVTTNKNFTNQKTHYTFAAIN